MASQEVIGFNGSLGIFTVAPHHNDVEPFQEFVDAVPAREEIHLVTACQEVKGSIRILLLNLQHGLISIALTLAVVLQIIHAQPWIILSHGCQHFQPEMLYQSLLRVLGELHLVRGDENAFIGSQCVHSTQQQPMVGNGGGLKDPPITIISSFIKKPHFLWAFTVPAIFRFCFPFWNVISVS